MIVMSPNHLTMSEHTPYFCNGVGLKSVVLIELWDYAVFRLWRQAIPSKFVIVSLHMAAGARVTMRRTIMDGSPLAE